MHAKGHAGQHSLWQETRPATGSYKQPYNKQKRSHKPTPAQVATLLPSGYHKRPRFGVHPPATVLANHLPEESSDQPSHQLGGCKAWGTRKRSGEGPWRKDIQFLPGVSTPQKQCIGGRSKITRSRLNKPQVSTSEQVQIRDGTILIACSYHTKALADTKRSCGIGPPQSYCQPSPVSHSGTSRHQNSLTPAEKLVLQDSHTCREPFVTGL